MRKLSIFTILFLAACSLGHKPLITIESFQETHIGMSEEAVREKFGEPLNRYHRENHVVIYEYVERFQMNNRVVEARRYYFVFKEGKLCSKQMTFKNQPAFEINSDYTDL